MSFEFEISNHQYTKIWKLITSVYTICKLCFFRFVKITNILKQEMKWILIYKKKYDPKTRNERKNVKTHNSKLSDLLVDLVEVLAKILQIELNCNPKKKKKKTKTQIQKTEIDPNQRFGKERKRERFLRWRHCLSMAMTSSTSSTLAKRRRWDSRMSSGLPPFSTLKRLMSNILNLLYSLRFLSANWNCEVKKKWNKVKVGEKV